MNKNKNLIFFLLLLLLVNCSFDNKTGIWSGVESEKIRIIKLEEELRIETNRKLIYSSNNIYFKEKILKQKITLSKPKKNLSWEMSGSNYQNFLGNIYLASVDNRFLKKKIGKNKLSLSKIQLHH